MRRFYSAVLFLMALAILFIVGMVAELPALALSTFCLWTPAAIFAGFAFARGTPFHVRIDIAKEVES